MSLCLLLILCIGCNSKPDSGSPSGSPSGDPAVLNQSPEEKMYDNVRSARFQISSALELLEACAIQARNLSAETEDPDTVAAISELEETFKSAGSHIADFADEPPTFEDFNAAFAKQDEERLKALAATEPAIEEMNEAEEMLQDMLGSSPPDEVKKNLENMQTLLKDAKDAVVGAANALKG